MKPLNRKSAFSVFAVVETIITLLLIVSWGMGKLSHLTFMLSLFTILFLSLAAVVFILYKYPATTAEKGGFDPDTVHVGRTREGTICEVITGLIIAAAWIIALATHFFIGEDGGILYKEFFYMLLFTLMIVVALIDTYTPSDLHLAGKLTNAKQVALAVRMNRIMALLLAMLLITWVIPKWHYNWLAICWLALAFGVFIVFRILIHKAK